MSGRHARPEDPDAPPTPPPDPAAVEPRGAHAGKPAPHRAGPVRRFGAWLGLRALDDSASTAPPLSTASASRRRPRSVRTWGIAFAAWLGFTTAPAYTSHTPTGFGTRRVAAWLGFAALGIAAIVGGVSLGSVLPWSSTTSQAVASVPTIVPIAVASQLAQRDGFAGSAAGPMATPAASSPLAPTTSGWHSLPAQSADPVLPVTTPSPVPVHDEIPITWDGDPASVSETYPNPGGLYGVAIMVRVEFAYAVPDDLKSLLEQAVRMETSKPIGVASWSWPDDQTLAFRPKEFWPAHTDVKFHFDWTKYGLADMDPSIHFRVGREQTLTVRYATQMGKLTRDGKFLRNVPVSMGGSLGATTSGIKAIIEKYEVKEMVNPRAHYDVMVPYAMRLTPSGEFLHSAPWNTANLGAYPTSHGCTNVSLEDGQWFYEHSLEGDPVIETGTGVPIDWWEGPGALWNTGWRAWTRAARALP